MADPEKEYPWFRFYPEAAHDIKIETIADELEVEYLFVFGAWTRILCAAATSPVRGSLYVTDMKRYSNANVTKILHCSNELTIKLMGYFMDSEMIDQDERGAYRVINWKKRNPMSDFSTDRVRKFRNKEKDETLQKRYCNVLDIDIEEDKDKELKSVAAENSKINIYKLYEKNIGLLVPMIADELKQAEIDFPFDWISDAFQEAVDHNARSWKYVRTILDRWKATGRGDNKKLKGKTKVDQNHAINKSVFALTPEEEEEIKHGNAS
jgi:DnaD/phage-associated family protein